MPRPHAISGEVSDPPSPARDLKGEDVTPQELARCGTQHSSDGETIDPNLRSAEGDGELIHST
jgi:hypothetical protein